VHVISGRPRDILDRWLGDLPLSLWAEHGFWHRPLNAIEWVATTPLPAGWRATIDPIVDRFTAATPGSSAEFKSASLSWHYRLADPEFGPQQAHQLKKLLGVALKHTPLEVREGKMVIEVRSRSAHKGLPIRLIVRDSGPSAALLALGDDATDEDMFAALPAHAASVHVGEEVSRADYRLSDPDAVRQWLELLVATPIQTKEPG
jgi:trehalose 6-phosphate synthase/phosphatase